MNLTIIFVLVGLLIIIMVGISVVQQYKKRASMQMKLELAKQRKRIDDVEHILANIAGLPISNNIILIMYGRVEEALLACKKISGTQQYDQKLTNTRQQMSKMRSNPPPSQSVESFQMPPDERSIIGIVQILKTIKAVLTEESQKGRIPHSVFNTESQKVSHFQLRLNIENTVTRAKAMIDQNRISTAQQLLNKVVMTLESLEKKMPDDSYIRAKSKETKSLMEKIKEREKERIESKSAPEPEPQPEEPKENSDEIFGDKKKW